jgi:hypothetical protein
MDRQGAATFPFAIVGAPPVPPSKSPSADYATVAGLGARQRAPLFIPDGRSANTARHFAGNPFPYTPEHVARWSQILHSPSCSASSGGPSACGEQQAPVGECAAMIQLVVLDRLAAPPAALCPALSGRGTPEQRWRLFVTYLESGACGMGFLATKISYAPDSNSE